MKKMLILICIMTVFLLCSFFLISCEKDASHETETVEETKAPIELTDEEKKEVRAKLRSMYDVTTDDAFILNDNVVCRSSRGTNFTHFFGDYDYGNKYRDKKENYYASYYNIYDENDVTVFCNVEGCPHDNIMCPARIPLENYPQSIITIFPESGGPLLYFIGEMHQILSYGGVSVIIPFDIKNLNNEKHAIIEFNTQTGARRTVASRLPFDDMNNAIYYNGILYGTCTTYYLEEDEELKITRVIYRKTACCVNVATGEYKMFENDCDTTVGGVWEGKVYLLDVMGNIYRCNLDLSDAEIIANVGEENSNMSNNVKVYEYQYFYVSDGRLYYSRDKRTYTDETVTDGIVSSTYHCQVFKLYTIDLTSDNLTPTLIDDEVLQFYVYNDMLYYTAFDYKFFGYHVTPRGSVYIETVNGGNLHRYNPKTGKTDVFLRDCGGDIDNIFEITDEYITFEGIYYAGYNSGYEYKGNRCFSLMRYNFKDNKLTIIRDYNY